MLSEVELGLPSRFRMKKRRGTKIMKPKNRAIETFPGKSDRKRDEMSQTSKFENDTSRFQLRSATLSESG